MHFSIVHILHLTCLRLYFNYSIVYLGVLIVYYNCSIYIPLKVGHGSCICAHFISIFRCDIYVGNCLFSPHSWRSTNDTGKFSLIPLLFNLPTHGHVIQHSATWLRPCSQAGMPWWTANLYANNPRLPHWQLTKLIQNFY